jgi:uncharacterized repeat protein (TIGR03803 family)
MGNPVRTIQTLSTCALLTMLGSCGGKAVTPFAQAPFSERNAVAGASNYRVVHNFHGGDGSEPLGALIDVNGTLYGTTSSGGTRGIAPKDGVAFSLTTAGNERVLHDFGATHADGTYPAAALFYMNGMLYGTTSLGNPYNTGTVFSLSTTGEEHVVYSFGEFNPSPMEPSASLIALNGKLYGASNFGGASNLGSVFSITPSGEETVVHSFGDPYKTDGQIPTSRLVELNGIFYGTTYEGGIYYRGNHCGPAPCPGDGTVFSLTPSGKVRTLHSFGNGSDGINPAAALIKVNGTLYGTTQQGGANKNCGTVFSITPNGTEHVLHNFGTSANDGCQPAANLTDVHGTLFGTTAYGGANGHYGTVFSISTTGNGERVLHSFGAGNDGKFPQAAVLNVNGTLYGTTESGGSTNSGTVFALRP